MLIEKFMENGKLVRLLANQVVSKNRLGVVSTEKGETNPQDTKKTVEIGRKSPKTERGSLANSRMTETCVKGVEVRRGRRTEKTFLRFT